MAAMWTLLLAAATAVVITSAQISYVQIDNAAIQSYGEESWFSRLKYVTYHQTAQNQPDLRLPEFQELIDLQVNPGRRVGGPFLGLGRAPFDAIEPLSSAEMEQRGAEWQAAVKDGAKVVLAQIRDRVMSDQGGAFGTIRRNAEEYERHVVDFFNFFYSRTEKPVSPYYYEVLNEFDTTARNFVPQGGDTAPILAEGARLFRDVCNRVRSGTLDDILCGGPAAGFPRFEVRDFDLWAERFVTFFEIAGSSMDFVSLHTYSLQGAYINAQMDLINAYWLRNYGRLPKFIFSEYAAIDPVWRDNDNNVNQPYTPARDWVIMETTISTMMDLAIRPDQVQKAIMFITTNQRDVPPYPWSMRIVQTPGGPVEWSGLRLIYRMLQWVGGSYRRTVSFDQDIQVISLVNGGRKNWILVKNMVDEVKNVVLTFFDEEESPGRSNVEERRLYLQEGPRTTADIQNNIERGGFPVYRSNQLSSLPTEFTLDKREFRIFDITLERDYIPLRVSDRTTYFHPQYLRPIVANTVLRYVLRGVDPGPGLKFLRIGISRLSALQRLPRIVRLNRLRLNTNGINFAGPPPRVEASDYELGVIEIPVASYLFRSSGRNIIALRWPDSGGYVTSVSIVSDVVTDGVEQASNLVENNGFESGTSSWSPSSGAAVTGDISVDQSVQRESLDTTFRQEEEPLLPDEELPAADGDTATYQVVYALEGRRMADLRSPGARLSQTVTVEPGKKYRVSCILQNADAGNKLGMTVSGYGGPTKTRVSDTTANERITFKINSRGSSQITISLFNAGGTGGYADDIQLVKIERVNAISFGFLGAIKLERGGGFLNVKVDYSLKRSSGSIRCELTGRRGVSYKSDDVPVSSQTGEEVVTLQYGALDAFKKYRLRCFLSDGRRKRKSKGVRLFVE